MPHEPLEDETDKGPQREMDPVQRWDNIGCIHHNGDVDVVPECAGVMTGEIVEGDG